MKKKISSRVKLIFPQSLIQQPIIWELAQEFDLVYNIRAANVTKESSWVVLDLEGREVDIDAGIKSLKAKGIEVEFLE